MQPKKNVNLTIIGTNKDTLTKDMILNRVIDFVSFTGYYPEKILLNHIFFKQFVTLDDYRKKPLFINIPVELIITEPERYKKEKNVK